MITQTQSPQSLKNRKLFLILPLIVVPLLTLLFWALGGGQGNDLKAQQQNTKGGLNTELPNANLKDDKPLDKLSYYEKASSDSVKLEDLIKNDPYYMQHKNKDSSGLVTTNDYLEIAKDKHNKVEGNLSPGSLTNHTQIYRDPNEAKVYKKLDELNSALNAASTPLPKAESYPIPDNSKLTSINSADVDRLEKMLEMNQSKDDAGDPEMNQLSSMMDKILDIQHPERINERLQKKSETHLGHVFSVTPNSKNMAISLLVSNSNLQKKPLSKNGFYPLEEDHGYYANQHTSIKASVYETQTLVNGSIIKLRLLNDIYINGTNIPKDNFVFGLATLNGERLNIAINSIRYENALFPVRLEVFDLDGINGIYMPGAITRDVAKQSTDRALQGLGLTALDPSIGLQAASAGIEAAKSLMSTKVKQVKVTVKAGYQVLLQDEKQRTSL